MAEIVDLGSGRIAIIGKKAEYPEIKGRIADDELAVEIPKSVAELWLEGHSADKNDN
jgi:hypothetical protein